MDRFDINKTEGYTCGLRIMIRTSSKDLIDLFGRAQAYSSDKIKRMWGLKIQDTMFAVYDYKYHPKKSDEVCYWNVGMWFSGEYNDYKKNYKKIRRTVLKFLKETEKEHNNLKTIDMVADWNSYLRTGKMIIY